MKKLTRRDYLKYMGIATVGTLGAAESNLFSEGALTLANSLDNTNDVSFPGHSLLQANNVTWPSEPTPPDDLNPGIRLVFAGMVAFTYKNKEARVVFHRESPDHQLQIIAFKTTGVSCEEIFRDEAVPKTKDMDLRIEGRDANARFFQSANFDRATYQGHEKDFRWLVDLEAPPCSNVKQKRKKDKFNTKLKLGHGVMYTYKRTGSTFLYDDHSGNYPKLGYVPKVMAADIRLVPGERVKFNINGRRVLKDQLGFGTKYEIFFLNECMRHCTQSDFHLAFDAVERPKIFELKVETKGDNGQTEGLCINLPSLHKISDESPCMGGGFGKGGGFP